MSISSDLQKMAGKKAVKPASYQIHSKEVTYFSIMLVISILAYAGIIYWLVGFHTMDVSDPVAQMQKMALTPMVYGFYLYASVILISILFIQGFLIGYLRGNAVKITQRQFPDIYEIAHRQSLSLGLKSIPDMYLLQEGGFINAFATKFLGRNYVVIYSEVLEEAYENNKDSVEFIIAHELGHVKRNHITKVFLLFPSFIIPFLYHAYSRACEYTCDRIGMALSPKGASVGLLLVAAGKKLYKKVNTEKFIEQHFEDKGFWYWISEKFSTHPHLTKRVRALALSGASPNRAYSEPIFTQSQEPEESAPVIQEEEKKEEVKEKKDDHSRFMPG